MRSPHWKHLPVKMPRTECDGAKITLVHLVPTSILCVVPDHVFPLQNKYLLVNIITLVYTTTIIAQEFCKLVNALDVQVPMEYPMT